MRSLLVVVDAEGIELELEESQVLSRRLALQETLHGLVETLDLAAGLRVIGTRVSGFDTCPVSGHRARLFARHCALASVHRVAGSCGWGREANQGIVIRPRRAFGR